MSEPTMLTSNEYLRQQLAKYLPLAKSHLLMIAHREDLSISADAKARLAELDTLKKELRSTHETRAQPVAWRRATDSPYEQYPRYVYTDDEPAPGMLSKFEPLYAAPQEKATASQVRVQVSLPDGRKIAEWETCEVGTHSPVNEESKHG